jgi:hypothetical protein
MSPAAPTVALGLQDQLEQSRAEREQLKQEVGALRQQLREYRQAVELLQRKSARSAAVQEELERLRRALEELRQERDTAARRTAPPTAPAPEAVAPVDEVWHVFFRDGPGLPRKTSGSAGDVHTGAQVGRGPEDSFVQLGQAEELCGQTVIIPRVSVPGLSHEGPARPPSTRVLPPTRPSLCLAKKPGSEEAESRFPEWLTWLVPITLALLGALLLGQKLFW